MVSRWRNTSVAKFIRSYIPHKMLFLKGRLPFELIVTSGRVFYGVVT